MSRIRKTTQTAAAVVWRIALYIRLSKEDWRDDSRADSRKGAKKEQAQNAVDVSRSIVEQKKMLQEYVDAHFQEEYVIVDFYVEACDIIEPTQETATISPQ